jgi:hypothetical protein
MRSRWVRRRRCRRLCRRKSGCRHGRLLFGGQLHEATGWKGYEDTVKLVAASQPRTTSSMEDTLAVAQVTNVRAGRLTQAILVRESHDDAAIAGTDARDSQRQEALENVRTGGTGTIEWQSDG